MTTLFIDGVKEDQFSHENVTGIDLLKRKVWGKEVIAMRVNGVLWDLTRTLPDEAHVERVVRDSPEGLEILRHGAAHILAQAVKELFPETQVTIGPTIDHGFYYDFYRETPFSLEDLPVIQKRMKEIVERKEPVQRHVWSREDACAFFKEKGETFKETIIRELPEGEPLSVYQQGNFIDLCRGPHIASTATLGDGFALTKLSGAYWRGNAQGEKLQRIYGTAWASKADLQAYLDAIEEAKKRSHVKLGKEMELFHLQEEAPGSVFWHPKGWVIYQELLRFIREKITRHGYREVNTPQMVSRSLWEESGHWDKYRENMFCIEQENQAFALKPMNCPCHVQIFKQGLKSYRDLPYRIAEFGSCMRNEPSGALSGIMRVRSFVQDDAHIFCGPEHINSETVAFCKLLREVYSELGFHDVHVKLALRPEKYIGSEEEWAHAEDALRQGALSAGLLCQDAPGDGAFYGPKLEFVIEDALKRPWQCGTLQVDPFLGQRLGAFYTSSEGKRVHPILLHRAILGSIERFVGILIEHYAGKLPLWLAPVQAVIATVSQGSVDYGKHVAAFLQGYGLRIDEDFRGEKIAYKIREHTLKKVPYIFVIGEKEASDGVLSVRCGNLQASLTLESALGLLRSVIEKRSTAVLHEGGRAHHE